MRRHVGGRFIGRLRWILLVLLLLLHRSASVVCCILHSCSGAGLILTSPLAILEERYTATDAVDRKFRDLMNAILLHVTEYFVGLVDKPHVLIIFGLPCIEYDDHGSIECLLSNCPADQDFRMAMAEEEESLQ